MVGGGFSRCAVKARPDAGDAPLWYGLATEITKRLYPRHDSEDQPGEPGNNPTTGDLLSLAQEYKTAFGRPDLHLFLQQQIRDGDFTPGGVHEQLMRLPWRDVFTTNWDTLLERTSPQVVERGYNTVVDMDQIPLANRPRIVKLHGSLPAQFPLIFTEEDYRTYPTEFAPFVNTVQQAMMETVFCLIGFSGNDPNFLHWSGWVRDNLGASAPKIYLAGWLGLSPHRRRMLEDRGVVPIDLAHHPEAHTWPDHLRHRYATEWLLHTLERGRPYDVINWPTPSTEWDSPVPDYLQPVVEVTSGQPRAESGGEAQVGSVDLRERVRETLEIWKHNRRMYPGWLVLPSSEERESLIWRTDEWERHILSSLPEFTPVERLNAIRELVWRREILLQPLYCDIESAAEAALLSIDCHHRTVDGVNDTKIDWAEVREAWRTVTLALATTARFRFDRDLFGQRIKSLEPFANDHPDVGHRIRHERCLWAVYSMDFEALEALLRDWNVEDSDPVWMIRKAAMLWESDRNDEAAELVKKALNAIRSVRDGALSVSSASREGWALWSAWTVDNRRMFNKRWDELARLKCDAAFEKNLIARRLSGSGSAKETPLFDLEVRRGISQSFSNAESGVAAYRAIRLSEVAGLPPIARHTGLPMGVSSDILELAAADLAAASPELAVRLVLRSCTYEKDEALQSVLSRTRIALIPDDSVRQLAVECTTLIEYGLPHGWVERIRVAFEVLSRLVLRLDPDSALDVFDKALEYYANRRDRVASHVWLSEPLENLLRRSWGALPSDHRSSRILDVLGAPIVGLDGFQVQIESQHPDPGSLLGRDSGPLLPERGGGHEVRWQTVARLLIRGLEASGAARKRAAIRLVSVMAQNRLTESEVSQVGAALWAAEHTPDDGLPENTDLYDWMFLVLPEPKPGLAEQRFRRKWLSTGPVELQDSIERSGETITVSFPNEPTNPARLEDTLWNLGAALSILRDDGRAFELSVEEREHIVGLVLLWAKADVPSYPFPFFSELALEPTRMALQMLPSIVAQVAIPEPVGQDLYQKLKVLSESGIPAFKPIGELVQIIPDRMDEMVSWLRSGLASDNGEMVTSALSCLVSWPKTRKMADPPVHPPPSDLFREVGLLIAARRKEAISSALQVAKLVFDEGTEEHREAMSEYVLQGLAYLAEELRYDREHDDDVPLLRWRCTQLASSMSKAGLTDHSTVAHWLEIATSDPLPEVRYAVASSTGIAVIDEE